MKRNLNIWLFLTLSLATPLVAYTVYAWVHSRHGALPVYGKPEGKNNDAHKIADFTLTNQDGTPAGTSQWKEKIVVADFFFTHCPVVCPKMTASIKRVQEKYAEDPALYFTSITVDPDRDNATRLKEYTRERGINTDNWDLLTGTKKEIYALARNSFLIVATDGDGGPDDFIHSEKLVLIDSKKRIRGFYDGTSESEVNQLIIDIKKLKNE
jgi:protein SCO1/2